MIINTRLYLKMELWNTVLMTNYVILITYVYTHENFIKRMNLIKKIKY